jgi:hypothetical protein
VIDTDTLVVEGLLLVWKVCRTTVADTPYSRSRSRNNTSRVAYS